jgi:hypothetical protein
MHLVAEETQEREGKLASPPGICEGQAALRGIETNLHVLEI